MANREFLMLSQLYKSGKHNIKGWWASEKLDGHRVFWDGGVTRGLPKNEVPWANNLKDERYVNPPRATGLWTRYGNVFHAPDWWLDELPYTPLDGELYSERGQWQALSKVIKRLTPDDDAWRKVRLHAFDNPPYLAVFGNGKINNPNYQKEIDSNSILNWMAPRLAKMDKPKFRTLQEVYTNLLAIGASCSRVMPIHQIIVNDEAMALEMLDVILANGGEGIILRNPKSYWEPKRSCQSLKLKPENDSEATVIGYTWGRETDKGSKLLGLMGAAICEWYGPKGKVQFELSGFTDSERVMVDLENTYQVLEEGYLFPGQEVSKTVQNKTLPRGSQVTFRFTEVTDDGKPKCARYWRKYQPV